MIGSNIDNVNWFISCRKRKNYNCASYISHSTHIWKGLCFLIARCFVFVWNKKIKSKKFVKCRKVLVSGDNCLLRYKYVLLQPPCDGGRYWSRLMPDVRFSCSEPCIKCKSFLAFREASKRPSALLKLFKLQRVLFLCSTLSECSHRLLSVQRVLSQSDLLDCSQFS